MNVLMFRMITLITMALWCLLGNTVLWAEEVTEPGPRMIVVSLDGTGDYKSIQEAVDAAKKGDTVFLKAGRYEQDITIHSKDQINLVGAGQDKVTLMGREDLVGADAVAGR